MVFTKKRTDESPKKRQKTDPQARPDHKFASALSVRQALQAIHPEALVETLTALRSQLTVRHHEGVVAPADARLALAREWMQTRPGAGDLFDIWERSTKQPVVLAPLVAVMACLVTLLSSHFEHHDSCQTIIRNVLSEQWSQRIGLNLASANNELILVTLKLLHAVSEFAGGRERKAIIDAFSWDTKTLTKLLFMRRKGKKDETVDPLARPDIRSLYMLFILSFVDTSTPAVIKAAFLEQHRDVFLSLFKGLAQDPYAIVRKVLEVCWAGIWCDTKLKRTAKVQVFGEQVLTQLLKLYDRDVAEDDDPEHVPADLVHHFLLAICTRPGVGVCFKDRGWYPRHLDEEIPPAAEDGPSGSKNPKIYNKILANLLRSLKVNEDLRQQELTLKILSACPELVATFWSAAGLTLEPRLSSKWLANIAIFGQIITLPVPTESFKLPSSETYHPSPPPLSTVLENILPSANTKVHMTKGLQSASPLVRHCTALALAKCLAKLGQVAHAFQEVASALEEDEQEGQWSSRRREVEREARRRVPDFQVAIAFAQQAAAPTPAAPPTASGPVPAPNKTQTALLGEAAHRLLWLYHAHLPSLVAEARYDSGKALQHIAQPNSATDVSTIQLGGLHTLQRLHVLVLLKETDQLSLSHKTGSTSTTSMHVLLSEYVSSDVGAIKSGITAVIQKHLSASLLFQHDPDEVRVWLSVLPLTKRAPNAHATDGTALPDEGEVTVNLLDECIQRCLKTPYRYLEELDSVGGQQNGVSEDVQGAYSPLLMTLLEQLSAKINGQHLAPGDVLAAATYVRKLVYTLATIHANLGFLRAFAERTASVLRQAPTLFLNHPVVTAAIVREAESMITTFALLKEGPKDVEMDEDMDLQTDQFLDTAASLPMATKKDLQKVAASELVDWLRLSCRSPSAEQLVKLFEMVKTRHRITACELMWYIRPEWQVLWKEPTCSLCADSTSSFFLAFMQTTEADFGNVRCSGQLVEFASTNIRGDILALRRVLRVISHRLAHEGLSTSLRSNLLQLITNIVSKNCTLLFRRDIVVVQEVLFVEAGPVKDLCCARNLDETTRKSLQQLVEECLDSTKGDDRERVSSITAFWVSVMRTMPEVDNLSDAIIWLKFATIDAQVEMVDWICLPPTLSNTIHLAALHDGLRLIQSLSRHPSMSSKLTDRLHQLLTLRQDQHLHETTIQILDSVIASVTSSTIPIGNTGTAFHSGISDTSLADVCLMADERWKNSHNVPREDLQVVYNLDDGLSQAQAQVIINLIYRSPITRSRVITWLSTVDTTLESEMLASITLAVCDTAVDNEVLDIGERAEDLWRLVIREALDSETSDHGRSLHAACAISLFAAIPDRRTRMISIFVEELRKVPVDRFTYATMKIGQKIEAVAPVESRSLMIAICDHGLKWIVRYYAEALPETVDAVMSIHTLALLTVQISNLKTHLVEPAVVAIIDHKLSNPAACKLAMVLMPRVSLKPVAVNKYLQSILQHSSFFRACALGSSSRAELIDLLHTLFQLHPSNTYQPSHIEPLVKIYGGTCSRADRAILAIFQQFESQRSLSVAMVLERWSSTPDRPASNACEALRCLDPAQMLRTCLAFPMKRGVDDDIQKGFNIEGGMIYDPVFVTLLFSRMIEEGPPTHAMGWVELLRTNVVSVILRCLSSKSSGLRDLALTQLASLWKAMENVELQERPHVHYILGLVKDLIPPTTDSDASDVPRIASYTTLLLAHAFRALFYPSHFTYPLTARFLLQRPHLDQGDVPMLFSMLYSSGDDWKKERGWIVRFLAEGMTPSFDDWRVFKRRHTWDLLGSLFQSEEKDRGLRAGVLDVLLALTCNRHATTSLVLKSAILPWIEVQLESVRAEEAAAWTKILENIVIVVDSVKIETSTVGQWRNMLARCVERLVDHSNLSLISSLCRVILRLTMLPYPQVASIERTIASATSKLQNMEASIDLSTTSSSALALFLSLGRPQYPEAPCGPHEVSRTTEDPLLLWGGSVEALWRSCMQLDNKCGAWDGLSARMVLWRSIVGVEGSQVGEWARRQANVMIRTAV